MPRYYNQPQDPQEQQLSQLAQIAQIAHLVSGPGMEQDQLAQQDQHQRLQAAIALMGLQQTAKNEDMQRVLQEKGIDEIAKSREATTKGNLNDTMLHALMSDPTTPLEAKLKIASQFSPEVAGLVKTNHEAMVASAIKNHMAGFQSVAATGKPEALDAFKTMNQIPDEAWDYMKGTLPDIPTTTPEASSLGTKLGKVARVTSGLDPLTLFSNLVQTGYKTGLKQGPDFWNALLDKKQPQPAQ